MTKVEEIFLISNLLRGADDKNSVDLKDAKVWKSLFLYDETKIYEDYFLELDEKGILNYEEVGEDGFAPIIMCSVTTRTSNYLRQLLRDSQNYIDSKEQEIKDLDNRVLEILTFDPKKITERNQRN